MHRLSPMIRALALMPLMAVGVDQARAVVLCGSDAQSCLEAAGRGWIGLWGVALIALYAVALALMIGRAAAPRLSFGRLWALGTAGVMAACGGQAAVASALGGAPLGGGWLGLLALCVLAGALLALILRTRPEALTAPRPLTARQPVWLAPAPALSSHAFAPPRRARGRAPPAI